MKFPRRFFRRIFRNILQAHHLDVEVRCLNRLREKDSYWPKHFWCRSLKELESRWPEVEELNRRGYDIHFTMVARQRKSQGKKEHPLPDKPFFACLWGDLDVGEGKPYRTLEDAYRALRAAEPQPNIVVESGSGLHPYYLLREPVGLTKERAEALLRALADGLKGDAGAARATRLMRVPQTFNWKTGKKKLARARYLAKGGYQVKELEACWKPGLVSKERESRRRGQDHKRKYEQLFRQHLRGFVLSGGAEATALCPFHDDHDPSFSVNLSTGLWKCHSAGCGAKGNLKQFCRKMKIPVPDTTEPRRFPRLTKVAKGDEWSEKKLFAQMHHYVTSQVHFTYDWQPVVVTLWAMGTYLYQQFPCYGHLWPNSPTTHSGKSKLLNVLWTLCYQALQPQVEPTPAALFRFPQAIGGTLLLDEVDALDPQKKADVISVLNAYLATAVVVRAVPGKGKRFTLETLPVYCPKVVAGIENLPIVLQDRCIKIVLHRKKKSEVVERFMPDTYAKCKPLRNQLEAWSVRDEAKVVKAYHQWERLPVPAWIDDRAKDILEPLFAIASVLPKVVTEMLIEAAKSIAKDRKAEEEESNIVVLGVRVLKDHFPKDKAVWHLRTEKALDLFSEGMPNIETKQNAQALLRRLGFHSTSYRAGTNQVLRAYNISRGALEKLCERYQLAR